MVKPCQETRNLDKNPFDDVMDVRGDFWHIWQYARDFAEPIVFESDRAL